MRPIAVVLTGTAWLKALPALAVLVPAAANIPAGYAAVGSYYDKFKAKYETKHGEGWDPGTAIFQYENDQPASTLWYHDHTLGMTRLNVYAGPAGFYLIRGGPHDLAKGLPGPAPARGDAPGTRYHEIPLAIQDRSFNQDGSLFYPASRKFFDGFDGPYIPDSDISPIWNPEFFGNTMVVNGRTWPLLKVEPRRYRFRILNGCNGRFLILRLVGNPTADRPVSPVLPFWQIGGEGGFLPAPVELGQLLMAPAERADVIVDFTGLEPNTKIFLIMERDAFQKTAAGSSLHVRCRRDEKLALVEAEAEPTRRRLRRGALTPGEQTIVQAFVEARLLTSDLTGDSEKHEATGQVTTRSSTAK